MQEIERPRLGDFGDVEDIMPEAFERRPRPRELQFEPAAAEARRYAADEGDAERTRG